MTDTQARTYAAIIVAVYVAAAVVVAVYAARTSPERSARQDWVWSAHYGRLICAWSAYGVPWFQARPPRAGHRCRRWTWGPHPTDPFPGNMYGCEEVRVERCRCGAWRIPTLAVPWTDRNGRDTLSATITSDACRCPLCLPATHWAAQQPTKGH